MRFLGLLRLLRLRRVGKLWGKLDYLSAEVAGCFRIAGLVGFFLLLGHWFGLAWYSVSIAPLEQSGDRSQAWFWLDDPEQDLKR